MNAILSILSSASLVIPIAFGTAWDYEQIDDPAALSQSTDTTTPTGSPADSGPATETTPPATGGSGEESASPETEPQSTDTPTPQSGESQTPSPIAIDPSAPAKERTMIDPPHSPPPSEVARKRPATPPPRRAISLPFATSINVRIQGQDRYETSANAALKLCGGGCDNVYIASGTAYADGITIAPLAITNGGVVLLTESQRVPATVAAALRKIAPKNIYLSGGNNAISAATADDLKRITGAKITRLSGSNRYETARRISAEYAQPTALYLTTGKNWPDALAIAPLAGLSKTPVVLTEGNTLGASALSALRTLRPKTVFLIGGSYSSAVINQVKQASGATTVRPISGPDRYATALAIAKSKYPSPKGVTYIAGSTFADAIGGASIAAAADIPIVLLKGNCSTPETLAYTANKKGIFMGGLQSTPSTATTTKCVPPKPIIDYSEPPAGSPSWLVEMRGILNNVGGRNYRLIQFDGYCANVWAIACAESNGTIKVHSSISSYSTSYKYTVMTHELAHQYQFKVWGTLMRSPTYKSLFRSNIEVLANCMATSRGQTNHGDYCSSTMVNWASYIWKGQVRN